jgi:hypothetical protein
MSLKTFFTRFFTWWNDQTFGTQLWTWRYGELVGEDEFGNRYFRTKGGKIDPTLGSSVVGSSTTGLRSPRASRPTGTVGCITPSMCRRRRRTTGRVPGRSRTSQT